MQWGDRPSLQLFGFGPQSTWGIMWLACRGRALNLSRLSAPWTETSVWWDRADGGSGGWGQGVGAQGLLWWNGLLYIFFIIPAIYGEKTCPCVPYMTLYFIPLRMDNEGFRPLAKGAQLLTGRERRSLWMAWLMDREMEAGTGLVMVGGGDTCGHH